MGKNGGAEVSVVYMIEVAIGIGLLILIHELGHFLLAKLSNVKVENFSIGFGPELAGYTRGETRYSLRMIPLGGYVKMLGEEPDAEATPDPRSFLSQRYGTKVAILAAGSIFNILLALVLFVAVFRIGTTFPAAKIGSVRYGTPAYYAGLKAGDEIVSIDGRGDVDFEDVAVRIALADPGEKLRLVVRRGGEDLVLDVSPDYDASQGIGTIGIEPSIGLTVGGFERLPKKDDEKNAPEPCPAEKAGVEGGWTIKALDGQPVADWTDYSRRVVANGLKPFSLTFVSKGAEKSLEIKPERSTRPLLGFAPAFASEVVSVDAGSLAAEMGLAAGDTVTAVGPERVSDYMEIRRAIRSQLPTPGPVEVNRGGGTVELAWPRQPRDSNDFVSGFTPKITPMVAEILIGSAAEMLGIVKGDTILSIDGKAVTDFESAATSIRESKGDSIRVLWQRGDSTLEGEFQPVFVGIVAASETVTRRLGTVQSCVMGMRKAWDAASQIYIIFRKAATGQGAIGKKLSGPVGLAYISYRVAKQGFTRLLFLLAVIGLNLGIMNLLPIPILDGGLLAVTTVEKLRGKPLSVTTQVILQYAGLVLLGALFVYVTWQDLLRLDIVALLQRLWLWLLGLVGLS
jgi:regulator of sigma E protease